ncbi:MAG: multifunctional CCA addition/repair protein [Gammaproteobacteria bacterium]|nr:multifunctional CCA addition/repair protein [Gammaproteobacteria bacterium]
MEIYQVGGAVRDKLLGLPVTDHDWVVVGATPAEMEARGFKLVGADFPVFLHPDTHEEYALARTERKTAPGYKGFAVHAAPDVTLEEDLKRRDLTINAMAMREDGSLIDPFNGAQDLKNKLLRHVSPAFAEDPVRILRVARFAARFVEFHIADETNALTRQMVKNGEVDALVPERVWAELERALGEIRPSRFFEVLRDCGALEKLFPELECLYGVPQPAQYHPEIDTGVHVMMVLDQATRLSSDARVRFAALLHDLGKGTTPPAEWPRHIGHEERSVDLVKTICTRFRVPSDYRDLAVLVARYHGDCHRADELRAATLLEKLEALDGARRPERFEQFLLACQADIRGRPGFEDDPYPQAEIFRAALRAYNSVSAQPLVASGLKGEAIAQELHRLRIQVISQKTK